jgi:hypothetical protein
MSSQILKLGTFAIPKIGSGNLMGYNPYIQAVNFITTANITNPTEITAINYLVKELVDNNLMNKFNFIYPMIGGNATRHSYNLINPFLHQLTFNGGWTHNTNGATPNGINGWANTNCATSLLGTTNNVHLSYFSLIDSAPGFGLAIGASQGASALAFAVKFSFNNGSYAFFRNSYTNTPFVINAQDARAFHIMNTTNPTSRQLIRNGILLNENTVNDPYASPTVNLYIGALNENGNATNFENKTCALASGGQGLSSGEITIFNTIVQQYQTILGRNV